MNAGDLGDGAEWTTLESAFQNVLATLRALSLVDDEPGLRARRALRELTETPFIPDAVAEVCRAISINIVSALYATNPGNRARRGRLIDALLQEASTVRAELWRSPS